MFRVGRLVSWASDSRWELGVIGLHRAKAPISLGGLEPGRLDIAADLFHRCAATAVRRFVRRRHSIDIVSTEGESDLRELGAVPLPVHLDVRHFRSGQARS